MAVFLLLMQALCECVGKCKSCCSNKARRAGEKQRVACARAILKNPRVLLLVRAARAASTLHCALRVQGVVLSGRLCMTWVLRHRHMYACSCMMQRL